MMDDKLDVLEDAVVTLFGILDALHDIDQPPSDGNYETARAAVARAGLGFLCEVE